MLGRDPGMDLAPFAFARFAGGRDARASTTSSESTDEARVHAADLSPIASASQTQSGWDLFLIFAAANIVATTLQVGRVTGGGVHARGCCGLVLVGVPLGSGLVAALAPVGSRLGVPSMVAVRAALGFRGAAVVAADALSHQLRVDRRQQHHRRVGGDGVAARDGGPARGRRRAGPGRDR